jgi:hypothetical protein
VPELDIDAEDHHATRRWPSLTKIETNEIRRLHDERQRLAR